MTMAQFIMDGLTVGGVYGLIALGFHLVLESTGLIDFAHGEKVSLGGLVVLALSGGAFQGSAVSGVSSPIALPMPIAIVMALALGFGLGIAYERLVVAPTMQAPGAVSIMATLGGGLFLLHGRGIVWGQHGLPFPPLIDGAFVLGPVQVQIQSLCILGATAAAVLGLDWYFRHTRYGKAMIAAATDSAAASLVGIDTGRTRMLAFGLSFTLAVLAGILIAPITLAGGTVGSALGLKGFAGAVIGGLGSPYAVVGGSLLIGVLEHVISGLTSYGYRDPTVSVLLIGCLLLKPSGLFAARRR